MSRKCFTFQYFSLFSLFNPRNSSHLSLFHFTPSLPHFIDLCIIPLSSPSPKFAATSEAESSRVQEPFDRTKFLEPEQQDRYDELIGRSIWSKITFEINSEGDYRSLSDQWAKHKWDTFLSPHYNINSDVLQEFYVNAFPSVGTTFSFSTKVGGRTIQFHRDAISEFLGNPLVFKEGQMFRY
ncbi:unnamed protein product [Vicia faba]|uniref:Uncharacterized protein n=1 Tax=Vicia faba TaxID=3906 RepID=A0AAV0ZKA0_VICFA|nr:unnamed protein product [Vicia faba]